MEIKMAENQDNSQVQNVNNGPTCMSSVNRIAHLPVVESTYQTANSVYEKVKDFNGVTKGMFETLESTVSSAVQTGKPYATEVFKKLDGPIKTVDNVLNNGLDYVESKVPAVKLPPSEIYSNTKEYVSETVQPRVDAAYKSVQGVVDPAVQRAKQVVDPAVTLAMPTVEKAYKMVEPMVQPAVDKANQLKEYGQQKVEEFLHGNEHTEDSVDCQDCKRDAKLD